MGTPTLCPQQAPTAPRATLAPGVRLQRQCACGAKTGTSASDEPCSTCRPAGLQAKLVLGAADDPLEHEADRAADAVLDARSVPRLQRSASGGGEVPASVQSVVTGAGEPLAPALRRIVEPRFGHDFTRVRVHADASAQRSAREVDALAYTVGRDIVFGAGQYAPGTRPGMRLLAHELAHVVQQSQAPAHVVQRQPAPPQAPRDEAPEADAPPTGAAAAPNLQMPTCQATGVSNWIKDPQKPAEEVFGLTELTGSGGTSPELRVGPSDTGKGFVVLPTGASLGKPIAISYMRPGRYPEHAIRLRTGQPGDPPGGYRPLWNITQAGSDAIKAGEQEHCDDYRAAFYFSLYRYAEIVNEIAAQKTVYPTEAAAKRVLDGKVFIDAKKLPAYFKCLADDMRDQRDQRTGGWHTPRKSQPELTYDSALSDHVAVRTLTEKSLPEVGRHGTGELPFRHAAPACVGLTTLPTSPTLPKNTP